MQQVVEGFHLSPQQARLWRFQQQSNAYRGECSVLIEGQFDVARFHRALEIVLTRHEIYRTCFQRVPGIALPIQVVNADLLYTWRSIDLSGFEPQEQRRQLEAFLQIEQTRVIDIERGPLVSSTILALTKHTYLWLTHVSALHADPQTLKNLVGDVSHCYHSPEEQADDVIQYIQFSEWQSTLFQEDRDEEKAYWDKKDIAALSTLSLPFKAKTKSLHSFDPDVVTVSLCSDEYDQMEAMAEQEQCTLPALFLTSWSILLWKLTGQQEILVGLSADGRIEDLKETAGLISKSLPLVCSLKDQQRVRDLLMQVQDAYDELLSHQPYFNWDELAGTTGPASFFCPFSFEWREQGDPLTAGTASFTLQQWESYSEPFHVKLVVLQASTGLTVQVHFDRSVLSRQQIQRMAEQFSLLLAQIRRQPEQRIETLDVLSEEERQQLLVLFNQNSADYPDNICLHQLFEQQVARTPNAIAVESEQKQITYGQLNRRANQVACYLQSRGVGPEVLVGIGLEQSIELVIGILGILKAGGAYVPLDRMYPKKRLSSMVEDAHISILLTNSHLREYLPSAEQVICLDDDWPSMAQYHGDESPFCTTLPTNLAYVMYTSGSTGQPKGVMIPHQGVVHYVDWSSKHYAVATGMGSPVHSPLSFDLTITSLFPPLIVGRRLVLVPREPGIEALRQVLVMRNGFSILKITPAHLNLLGQLLQPKQFVDVTQALIIGGEELHGESVSAWRQYAPATRLINEYGPTETVVGCCIYEIPQDEELVGAVPIGRPIPNTQIYLLDTHMRLVPFGVSGELYVGGVGLGRGYLNRPDLTAERFIANPFSREPGACLYKTGDVARYRSADGTLEYLGRIDNQVKLRGYRIEMGEIEAVLRQHPLVWDCAVQLQEEGPGAPRLIGYVVARTATGLTVQDVREALSEKLPEYMVPSSFVMLENLPLTANGKLDRRQLPQPGLSQESTPGAQSAPRNPIEEMVVHIWKDLLLLPALGIHDNFFALGGHSLLATRVMARLQAVFQIVLSVQILFEAPTVARLAQRVEQALYQDEKRAMPPLVARARPEEIPLSFAQQRLWFLDQLEPGTTTYLIPRALSMRGMVDVRNLERSLQEMIRRHEILRTTFPHRAGRSMQVIHPASSMLLPVIDLQALRAQQREEEARRLARQEAQHPCDLTGGPLLRIFLLRAERQEHVLLFTLHHIITDGWSNDILVHELTTLYRAFLAGQTSPLAPLPIQYADYALWQREWLQGDVLEAQLTYWREQLAHIQPLALPTDHPHPAVQSSHGASQIWQLPIALTEEVQALSQHEHVTMFMMLLAVFQVLLARYTGQHDISVGTPIANRRHAEVEGMIGFFVNTLVLRTDLSDDPSFLEMLQRVRKVCLGAYAHQDLPFENVVVELEPERDLSRSPLFQVMFLLQNASREQEDLAGINVRPLHVESTISKFDLTFSVEETEQGLRGALEYNADLFEAETIRRLLEHWQTLLEGVVHDPQMRLSEQPLLTAREREQLLGAWNATQEDYPQELCVHELFEQQVERTPDVVALVFEETHLTYGKLNQQANHLAHHLQKLGVGPEMRVGISMERRVEMIVALLAVLKAGGAYVPLDPGYPAERLAFMVQAAQVSILLTTEGLPSSFSPSLVKLYLEQFVWADDAQRVANPHVNIHPDSLAYMIYTSGSTGQPKGVLTRHRSVVNYVVSARDIYRFQLGEQILQFASINFDTSAEEIYPCLISGATLVLRTDAMLNTMSSFLSTCKKWGITILDLPTAYWHELVRSLEEEELSFPSEIHTVLIGGERALPERVQSWQKKIGSSVHLFNTYGPTEATIVATIADLTHLEDEVSCEVPIGKPIANTQVYLLDSFMHPVPIGIIGEMYIGGVGLARGYFQRPDLTAEHFIAHPFANEPGLYLYKTGDLARYRQDGTIEFSGRVDQQVKIRGYRIELGEIETSLGALSTIQDCVVFVREDRPGDRRLVAYVVVHQGHTLTSAHVRSSLQDRLPAYMIPSTFVFLDALPLTPNGKVDRQALPAPESRNLELTEDFVGPRNGIETTLVNIWSQVLHVEHISIYDNFFALGGDSILSIQIVARAKQAGLYITPRQLFQNQSIAQLSGVVTRSVTSYAEQNLITGPVPLTPIQHWFFDLHLPVQHHFNQAVMLETRQSLRPAWVHRALLHLVLHHDALRLRFMQQADGWQQEVAGPPSHPFFLRVDLSALSISQQRVAQALLTEEAQASIDLTAGILLRALFFAHGSGNADHLLLIIHHLAVDGVSWRILVEDLESLCQQCRQEEDLHLAEKTVSWQRWAQRLQEYAQTEELLATQRYWLALQRRMGTPIPVDLPDGENTIASKGTFSISLDATQTQLLLHEVPVAYHTQINDVLLTALVYAFAPWTGQHRLLIDLEGHGREELATEVDISRTVGWFTTVFPLLLDIEQATGLGEALKAIKEQVRQVPQKGLSYGVLRYLSTDPLVVEQCAKLPQAEVIFNYLGQFDTSSHEQPLFRFARVSPGSAHSTSEPQSHLLDINGQIAGGVLHFTWSYSQCIHHRDTIERLARSFIEHLERLIAHCQSQSVSEYTPSDFPLAVLDQPQLDVLTRQISQMGQGRSDQQIEDIYPLSPLQGGLLFHCLYAPQSAVYCAYFDWMIQGPFNADAWRWAWQQVINRHPILRTCFVWQGLTEPLQIVCTQVEAPWRIHDWRSLSVQNRQQSLDALRQQEEREGFDLQVAPLLRLSLIRLDEQTFSFHLALHHLLLDGWSLPRLTGEVLAYYLSYNREQRPRLAPVRPYRDYIAWLQQQDTEQAEQFWRRYLLGFITPTKLAVDHQSYTSRGQFDHVVDVEQRRLSKKTTAALQLLAKRHHLTLNTIVQGAWALLLSHYSGEADVLFGATVSGRPAEIVGIETMIGLFINTLPVRVHVEQEASFLSWLTQLQESQSEVRQYEYTPLVDIQRWSEVPMGQPLFDSLLLFQNYPLDPMEQGEESELTIRGKRSVEYTNYALTLKAAVANTTLTFQLAYDTSRFGAASIARFMDHVCMVLEAIVLNPQQRLADVPLLTAAECRTVLVEWNDTQASFAAHMSIHERFEQQVARTPDAIALVFQDTCVTYRFVDAAAQRVALSLQALEIAVGVSIGLCVERSLEQVIGMLGILKAGGAYVPLDPTYPHDRLIFMLEDSCAAALVTQPWLVGIFPDLVMPSLSLTAAIVESNSAADAAPRKCGSEQVAYVIYTSGSTGRPKGTIISHRAVGNFFTSMSKRPGMTAGDCILAVTSFSFDIAALELLLPLTLGARVHIASQRVLADGAELAILLDTSGATLLQATPSTWRMLILAGWAGKADLKMLCGGEALPLEMALQLQSRGSVLWNMYGPTETTIWSAIEDVSRAETQIPIGSPIENTQLYVLDDMGSPVPLGGVGELYIAGEGVAYGYWHRPDLSAERFLPNPFGQQAGARMYKTGDRVRWLSNGTLEYLGRRDQQIKLRGHRIELNEIEAVLRDYPAVQEAVVILQEVSEDHTYLIAYVVARVGMKPTSQELPQYLQKRLPDYMVPTAFLFLESLPLTPNGKVNRKALPAPDLGQLRQGDEFTAPETTLQEQLSEIWIELLHLPRVGIHHNFFALGGNSLLATRLMVRIQSVFLVEVPLRELFEAQTIAELALVIEQLQIEFIAQADAEEMIRALTGKEQLSADEM